MSSTTRRVALIGLAGLCLLLSVAHQRAAALGKDSPVSGPLLAIMNPGQRLLSTVAVGIRDFVTPWRTRKLNAQEAARLRARAALTESLSARVAELEAENARLRTLMGAADNHPDALLGRVIGEGGGSWRRTLILNRGTRDGVRPRDTIITAQGVVGQVVQSLSPWSSVVLLITDPESEVSVLVQRTRAQAVVKGTGGPLLELAYLPKPTNIRKGDAIVTSGKGGVYPSGLLVGRVSRLSKDESGTSALAYITPAADLSGLEEALVLRKSRALEALPRP